MATINCIICPCGYDVWILFTAKMKKILSHYKVAISHTENVTRYHIKQRATEAVPMTIILCTIVVLICLYILWVSHFFCMSSLIFSISNNFDGNVSVIFYFLFVDYLCGVQENSLYLWTRGTTWGTLTSKPNRDMNGSYSCLHSEQDIMLLSIWL